jgi:purine-binding chemotaxis protein CheW
VDTQLVVFEQSHEWYGIEIHAVESIIPMQPITPVPHAPAYLAGLTNLRGEILPVIDLGKRLGLPQAAQPVSADRQAAQKRIIVVNSAQGKLGMIVDDVMQVLRVPEDGIDSLPALALGLEKAFVLGLARVDQRLVILLNLDEVLHIEAAAG